MTIRWNRILAVAVLSGIALLFLFNLDQIVEVVSAFLPGHDTRPDPLRQLIALGIFALLAVSIVRILLLEDRRED